MGGNGKKFYPMGIPTCGNPMGNRHSHMWESYGVIRAYFNVSGYNH